MIHSRLSSWTLLSMIGIGAIAWAGAPASAHAAPPKPGEALQPGESLYTLARDHCAEPKDDETFNLCVFKDLRLAAAAELAAPNEAKRAIEALTKSDSDEQTSTRDDGTGDEGDEGDEDSEDARQTLPNLGSIIGLGNSGQELFAGLAKALGEFILSRAQHEAVVWTLEDLAKDLCTKQDTKQDTTQDIPWFPHLCALAGNDRIQAHTAGDALLVTAQGALRQDITVWPGVMLGQSLGNEGAGVTAMAKIARGINPALALHELGEALSSATPDLGCSLTAPAEYAAMREKLSSNADADAIAMLGSLVSSPACAGLWEASLGATGADYPHLRTLVAIHSTLGSELEKSRASGAALAKSLGRYDKALAGPAPAPTPAPAKATDKPRTQPVVTELQRATLAVFDATLAHARLTASMLEAVKAPEDPAKQAIASLDKAGAASTLLHALTEQRWGEAVALLIRFIDEQIEEKTTLAQEKTTLTSQIKQLEAIIKRLSTVAALLDAGDDDEALEGLMRQAAHAPGSWRTKQRDNAFTVSLTAFPGLYGGAEWRWGPYGAVIEGGRPIYAQAPTLALPVGVDLAWSIKPGDRPSTVGLFFPLIDPAAFLGYDKSQNGKLPAPRPTTVLSPGVGLRFSLPNTPFGVMVSGLYRPQYRTWKATASEPGADVIQIGASLVVDATLWVFRNKKRSKRTKPSK